MTDPKFLHLNVKSAYSLSEGAIHVKELAKLCNLHQMPALAMTDSNNLFGALEFSEVMAAAGIQPIIGCAVQVAYEVGDNDDIALASYKNGNGSGKHPTQLKLAPILLLTQNAEGYGNLIKLVSKSFLDSDDGEAPHLDLADIESNSAGLLCLSGGPSGPLSQLLLLGRKAAAENLCRRLAATFANRFYIELQRHGTADEASCEAALLDFAYEMALPLVATNEVYFATRGMYEAHDALICIADGVTVGVRERRRYTQEHYFKTAEEMIELFADLPEAIHNSVVIAQRCAFKVALRDPILPNYSDDPRDEPDALRQMARHGLQARLEQAVFAAGDDEARRDELAQAYWQRFDYEMGVITEMGFSGYFLIVADFIHWAKDQDIPVGPGRGSGAGSVVSWALNITNLDPLRFGLVFERFLNPERISMPDFDIDFCQDKRDRVIRYVQDKYGHDQVAQIITFGKLQARAVLRDVGRVLQMPYGLIDRISKLVPNNPANPTSLPDALAGDARFQEIAAQETGVDKLYDIAQKLEGLYRHASTHAAGVVIGDRPLDQLVPLYRDPRSEMPVTQFNMKWVEPAGLVKFDFLGLKTLTVLDRAIKHIRARGREIDLDAVTLTDPATFELISKGDTVGVFQLESSGMRDMLRKIKPDVFEDIIAIVALYRPGPMDNIPRFIAVKHGREKPDYLHEWLEPVLKDTYGIIVYQEQVLQIAQVLAGYSLGQADLLRKAMGKKIKAEMDAQRATFAAGAKAKGVDPARASTIFDLVAKFAGYGFNRAHSACYALIGYHTAYLKANHPVEFMAASMTLDLGNTDKLNLFRQELDRMKIKLFGPNINRSDVDFAVEELGDDICEGGAGVRYALAAIKNVGREAMRSIVAERRENGPFKDLWDFAGRIDGRQLNKRQLENLARAGAFDGLNANRAQVHASAELLLRFSHQAAEARDSAQVSLFGAGGDDTLAPPPRLPEHAGWTNTQILDEEYDAVGFYLSAHPLDAYHKLCQRQKVKRFGDVQDALERGGASFKLAGTVLRRQERKPASGGSPYAHVQLSDQTGMFEVTVWSETLANCRELLEPGKLVILSITAQSRKDQVSLIVNSVQDIEQASANDVGGVRVFLREPEAIQSIRGNLLRAAKGRGTVTLTLQPANTNFEVDITLNQTFALNPALRGAIKAVPGVLDVHDL